MLGVGLGSGGWVATIWVAELLAVQYFGCCTRSAFVVSERTVKVINPSAGYGLQKQLVIWLRTQTTSDTNG